MSPKKTTTFFDTKLPIVFAHRGASGSLPENTMPAFEEAVRLGATYLETDVQITKDGVLVLAHDPHLGRAGDEREIKDLTFSELMEIDAGAVFTTDGGKTHPFRGKGFRVPTLEEFLKKFKDRRFNIEVKDGTPASARLVLLMLKKYDAEDRVLLASERPGALPVIRKEAPHIPTSASRAEVVDFLWRSALLPGSMPEVPFDALQIPEKQKFIPVVNARLLSAARRLGVGVHVWTINDKADMERLFKRGIDGIFTDFPAIGIEAARPFQR
jgi:glycerophosphoryl diester phosphodiesterase